MALWKEKETVYIPNILASALKHKTGQMQWIRYTYLSFIMQDIKYKTKYRAAQNSRGPTFS